MARLLVLLLLAFLLRHASCSATVGGSITDGDMSRFIQDMPQCGLDCILQQVPLSACGSITNLTCLCTDEPLRQATQLCVATRCESRLDALAAARIEAEGCHRPVRDRRDAILKSVPVIQVITFIACCLRMYARWTTSDSIETEDWLMAMCVVLYVPFSAMGMYIAHLVFGRDIWLADPDDLTHALKLFYVTQTFYVLCLALVKIVMLYFFLRIFPSRPLRRAIYASAAFIALSTTVIVLIQILQCLPVEYNWEGWKGGFGPHRCVDVNALTFAAAAFSIVQDVIVLVLPLPSILRLQVSKEKKIGIILMFSLGVFVLGTSCARVRFIIIFAKSTNPTWDYVDALVWSGIEISVSLIVVSLPSIRLLLSRSMPGLFSTARSLISNRKTGTNGSSSYHMSKPDGSVPGDGEGQDDRLWIRNAAHREELDRNEKNTALSKLKWPVNSIYSLGAGRDQVMNESQEVLELGDKVHGEAHVVIGADDKGVDGVCDDAGAVSREQQDSGIRVKTTTTVESTWS